MKKHFLLPAVIGVGILGTGFQLWGQQFSERGQEEILFMEIPTVIVSSKREQPLTEAASTIEVVTSEDIKQSGATNIGDVLRSVAGIDVREAHTSQHVIGVRGFADTSHVLVTVDGNNVFMYHANHIFLDWAPIDLEEVERIEIIKGPGAIFYGGSAFSGVINIVTKTPKQLQGTQINVFGGSRGTIRSNLIHAGTYKKLDYSVAAGHREAKEWEPADIPEERDRFFINYVAGKAVYHLDDDSSLSLAGRYSDADNVISRMCNPATTFLSLRYDRPDFWVRCFYNHHEKTSGNDSLLVDDANYELELLRVLRWNKNITSFGGYVKHTAWSIEALKGDNAGAKEGHDVEDVAVNLENEYHANDQLILTLGARGEYYSRLDFLGLARGSVIYKPTERQTVRLTVASGYYIPSLIQHTNQGEVIPFALGNPSLEEEKITSYELSYHNILTSRVRLKTSIFYNDYRDLIDNVPVGPVRNIADAHQYGGEVHLDFRFTDWLTGYANYAFEHIRRDDFRDLEVNPQHKVNCGLRAKFSKWSTNVGFHYVDRYYEMYSTSNPLYGRVEPGPSRVDSYATVDARVAYCPNDRLEVSVAARNLFNDRHYESNSTGLFTGDKIGRMITAGMSYSF